MRHHRREILKHMTDDHDTVRDRAQEMDMDMDEAIEEEMEDGGGCAEMWEALSALRDE